MRHLARSSIGALARVVGAAAIFWAGARADAQIVNLADNNSSAQIDVGSQAGMFNWFVEGQNQLAQQWFWYRIGNAPEASIDTISLPAIVQPTPRAMSVTYSSPIFSVRVDYLLTGGLPGSGVSDISESITIHNLSNFTLDFRFFQYSDFNLAGTAGGDTVQLGKNLQNKFNEAFQADGAFAFTETVNTPGATRGEVAFWNSTLLKLNDANPDNLNNNPGPIGPGDVTWALQWDFLIPAGGSALISKDKYFEFLIIPEPSTVVLGGLGLGVLGLLRFWRSRRG